jgi:uncharacterized protein YdhG (YjbR/CyaY superfamily)
MVKTLPAAVKKHYQSVPSPHKETMLEMRKRILEIIPQAEEVVSYGMPAFKVDGNIVAGLLANKKHVGYYPFSGSVLINFKKELAKYGHTKSAIHVPMDKPISKALLSKLIKSRISQCPVRQGAIDLNRYAMLDKAWRELGLAAPARRALIDHKLYKISDLKKFTMREVSDFHGIGSNALVILKRARAPFKI